MEQHLSPQGCSAVYNGRSPTKASHHGSEYNRRYRPMSLYAAKTPGRGVLGQSARFSSQQTVSCPHWPRDDVTGTRLTSRTSCVSPSHGTGPDRAFIPGEVRGPSVVTGVEMMRAPASHPNSERNATANGILYNLFIPTTNHLFNAIP